MSKIKVQIEENVTLTWDSEIELPEGINKETFIERLNNDNSKFVNLFWDNAIANEKFDSQYGEYKINEN